MEQRRVNFFLFPSSLLTMHRMLLPPDSAMIGVVHRDPDGERRLLAALEARRPDLITLEVSRYAIDFRQQRGAELLARLEAATPPGRAEHGEMQAIRETLRVPFEARAAWKYAETHAAAIELVDDSELSRELLAEVESELLTPENLRALVERPDVPLTRAVDSFYRRTRRLLADEPVAPARLGFSPARFALLEVRDENMEIAIRRALAAHPGARWLHVGGVFHILRVRGLRLLWERFADEGVARFFLDEWSG
jgi:hypothetical protein